MKTTAFLRSPALTFALGLVSPLTRLAGHLYLCRLHNAFECSLTWRQVLGMRRLSDLARELTAGGSQNEP